MSTEGASVLLVVVVFLFVCYVIAKAIKVGVDSATTKQCPACAERVKNAATKCRFCGTELKADAAGPEKKFPWQ
jgi:hypothetical protein